VRSQALVIAMPDNLDRAERRRLGAMAAFILALHVIGWVTLVVVVVPQQLALGSTAFGLGLGVTAYALGLRHAFDADHIAAIDNTTRRLLERGRRPASVGFWFSLGHSTVVFALALLVALGARSLPHALADDRSGLGTTFAVTGTCVSAAFLLAVAALNAGAFVRLWRLFRHMRTARPGDARVAEHLHRGGPVMRLLARAGRPIDRPGRMYAVGLLFGLSFDTATEIVLLVLAGAGAASGLPWYAVLCLPVLFTAGMALVDTLDGSFMSMAYGWALAQPVRKLYVNLTMTGLSVAAALTIAACEVAGLAGDRLGLDSGWWAWTGALSGNTMGLAVAAALAATWAVALLVWRYGRIEERWGGGA
jgi:nickel/cobalt transporter (NiCoT) family protein